LSRYPAFGEHQAMEVAWTMVWLRDFLYNPRELERLYGEIHLLTSLRHRAGFAHVAPPPCPGWWHDDTVKRHAIF
jgi:hypothetical protein